MNREEAKEYIKNYVSCERFLEKSKKGMYCCPHCGSGKNENLSGAVKYYKTDNTYHCHACGEHGDVIKLYQTINAVDFVTALEELAQIAGVYLDRPQTVAEEKAPQADYTEYYKVCQARLHDPEAVAYLARRGISVEIAELYGVGYDPEADPASAPGAIDCEYKPHPAPRLILPTCKSHYVARRIDGIKNRDKINPKGGSPRLFNPDAIYNASAVFVCEGIFDALSILEAGKSAVALSSAGNTSLLLEQLKEKKTTATIILCPDNDADPNTAKGVKGQFKDLAKELRQLNISCIVADINGSYKDANDHLIADRDSFFAVLEEKSNYPAKRPDNTNYYINNLMADEIASFRQEKKTGFRNLDEKAGGLYTGLYAFAAIPSLGKTTFCLQLADQLAAAGDDVLFFSLEQSRLELVSKSLARITAQRDPEKAVSSLSIRKGYFGPDRSVLDAAEEYKQKIAERVSVKECNFGAGINFIRSYTENYIKSNGVRPVIFIDHLQALQPEDDKRQTTKEIVDNNITELKRISRDLNLTVIVVCTINRANYLTPINYESLKESGAIEYAADVVWGLQLQCLSDPDFEKMTITSKREKVNEEKEAEPRKIALVCLKNRYGISHYSCLFDYYPAHDLFQELYVSSRDFDHNAATVIRR